MDTSELLQPEQLLDGGTRLHTQIALVFTDMVGSSAAKRAASLGPDSSSRDRAYLANIQSRHLRAVREEVALHGGKEIMTIGDSFFLTFDDPAKAVRCCAAIQHRLRADPILTPGGQLRLRIGVHLGTPEYFENSWHGTDVDLAARAESVGSAEQIIVTDEAKKAIGNLPGVRFRRLGTFGLKGVGNVVLWDADYAGRGLRRAAVRTNGQKRRTRIYVLSAVLTSLLVAAVLVRNWPREKQVSRNISVLVADFANKTSDPVFDKVLEQPISTALEGASFVNSFNRNQARKVAKEIGGTSGKLDDNTAQLVARREGIPYVITGAVERKGSGYLLMVRAIDAITGKQVDSETVSVKNKDAILKSVPRAVAKIRSALGDTTPVSVQMAAAETYTASSLEAAKAYEEAQDLQWSGNFAEATKLYKAALALDPQLGRAYSGLAVMEYNAGSKTAAAEYFKQSMANIGRMSERERYRTRGGYYLQQRDVSKAVDEYTQLLKKYPADSGGFANLALAYFFERDMEHALQEGMLAVALSPRNVPQRNNVGLYAMYAGEFERAIAEQDRVLELNPKFNLAYVSKAISELALGRNAAAGTWDKLARLNPRGASTANLGKADLALYEGRINDAVRLLHQGVADDLAANNTDEAAVKWANIAYAESYRKNRAAAAAAADSAVKLSHDYGVRVLAAEAYVHAGQPARARAISAQLGVKLESDARAYAKLIEGMVQLEAANPVGAIAAIRESQKIADTWLGRFYLGRAYLAAKAYAEADSEFDTCLRRNGEAAAIFLDEEPTYHLVPLVNYYDGIAREGLHRSSGMQSLQAFIAARSKQQGDPLVAEAVKRLLNTSASSAALGH